LPTVHPCTAPGTAWGEAELTDHGELWCRPWHVVGSTQDASGAIAIVLEMTDLELPFRFTRALRLSPQEAKFHLEYRLKNRGNRALPYVWAAHPLIPLEPGMQIELPPGTGARCAGAVGGDGDVALPRMDCSFAWPEAPTRSGGTIDLGRIPTRAPGSPGRAVKVFTEHLSEGWVRAIAPDGREALELAFCTEEIPCVGLWINDGGWSGAGIEPYWNLGIEPTTAPCDTLREAIDRGTALYLGAGESRCWRLTLSLDDRPMRQPCVDSPERSRPASA
jgi:hypothetical protein